MDKCHSFFFPLLLLRLLFEMRWIGECWNSGRVCCSGGSVTFRLPAIPHIFVRLLTDAPRFWRSQSIRCDSWRYFEGFWAVRWGFDPIQVFFFFKGLRFEISNDIETILWYPPELLRDFLFTFFFFGSLAVLGRSSTWNRTWPDSLNSNLTEFVNCFCLVLPFY